MNKVFSKNNLKMHSVKAAEYHSGLTRAKKALQTAERIPSFQW